MAAGHGANKGEMVTSCIPARSLRAPPHTFPSPISHLGEHRPEYSVLAQIFDCLCIAASRNWHTEFKHTLNSVDIHDTAQDGTTGPPRSEGRRPCILAVAPTSHHPESRRRQPTQKAAGPDFADFAVKLALRPAGEYSMTPHGLGICLQLSTPF